VVTDERDLARHYRTIYRFVRRRSSSREDAEDVTQTVFVEAAANLTRVYADGRSPLAWLFTVASRRLIDQARQRGRAPELLPLDAVVAVPGEGRYGEAVGRSLREAIALLPENQRRVVARRLIKGASFAEIANDEEATVAACKMRYMRALETIRIRLEHEGLEP
jgi:RNA polymerase sigma-70 factor (ECF subfamily)